VSGSGETTAQLIERARSGDRDALEGLLRRHAPVLRRWARGRLPGWARTYLDTDDLVQDTLVQTLGRLDAFEPRGVGAFQAYLRQAVLNRIRNEMRNATRRPLPAPLDSAAASREVSPLERAMTRQGLEHYDRALSRLPPADRDAVVARLEFGLSYQEIAAAQHRPSADAARVAVGRALLKLAGLLRADRNPA
jgi:RNA polymerase sigma-70 factor (ECF subfamily)